MNDDPHRTLHKVLERLRIIRDREAHGLITHDTQLGRVQGVDLAIQAVKNLLDSRTD